MQTELLGLPFNSQQLFANKSGHNLEMDGPEAAVEPIERMVELTCHQAPRRRDDTDRWSSPTYKPPLIGTTSWSRATMRWPG